MEDSRGARACCGCPGPLSMARPLLLLLCLSVLPGSGSSGLLVVDGAVGETKTLHLALAAVNISGIFLRSNQSAVGTITTGPDRSPQVILVNPKWKDRLIVTSSYALQLGPLMEADTGSYHAEIVADGFMTSVDYTLRVFRRLGSLDVVHSVQHSENGTCELQLACVLPGDPGDSVRFWWMSSWATVGTEANLTVSWDPKEAPAGELTCTAENPVSNTSTSINASALCEVPSGRRAVHVTLAVIVLSVLMIVVLLPTPFLLLHLWKKSLRGTFYVSGQQTPCPVQTLRSTERADTPPGTTVYAQITHPQQDTAAVSSTIYSTVSSTISSTIYSAVEPRREVGPVLSSRYVPVPASR